MMESITNKAYFINKTKSWSLKKINLNKNDNYKQKREKIILEIREWLQMIYKEICIKDC